MAKDLKKNRQSGEMLTNLVTLMTTFIFLDCDCHSKEGPKLKGCVDGRKANCDTMRYCDGNVCTCDITVRCPESEGDTPDDDKSGEDDNEEEEKNAEGGGKDEDKNGDVEGGNDKGVRKDDDEPDDDEGVDKDAAADGEDTDIINS